MAAIVDGQASWLRTPASLTTRKPEFVDATAGRPTATDGDPSRWMTSAPDGAMASETAPRPASSPAGIGADPRLFSAVEK